MSAAVAHQPLADPVEGLGAPAEAETAPQRRKRRRRRADLVVKADRACARAFFGLLMPVIPGWMAWQAFQAGDLNDALVGAGTAVALALVLAPLNLWWSIAAIRRGTRWLPVPILTGFVAGIQTVALLAGLAVAAVGYTVVTGDPVPGMERYPQVRSEWMAQDWHDTLLGQPYNGQDEPDIAGLIDRARALAG